MTVAASMMTTPQNLLKDAKSSVSHQVSCFGNSVDNRSYKLFRRMMDLGLSDACESSDIIEGKHLLSSNSNISVMDKNC